ncbi:DgyrCDS8111 [Dimorphilus gyrociliatus]|uniref:Phosphodiesterase n=1 Tax=Dimorphilus gyrociliatus TaxID=2664684 RepID=A0A7I8VVG9_9ANNE|nr:DgyrCDS8111 [Dimorphilus gyrociliatus]
MENLARIVFPYKVPRISIVTPKKDTCIDAFIKAAAHSSCPCDVHETTENIPSTSVDIFLLDRRTPSFDVDSLCKALRNQNEFAIIAAIIPKNQRSEGDKTDVGALLATGYNYRLFHTVSKQDAYDDLLVLFDLVKTNLKLRVSSAVLAALENCTDAVEIREASSDVTCYSNASFKQIFADHRPPIPDEIRNSLSTETKYSWKAESGRCTVEYVSDLLVTVRRISPDFHKETSNGTVGITSKRKDSFLTRFAQQQSVMLDAPIMRVINVINMVKETTPQTENALDSALEILRSAELYSPLKFDSKIQDDVANDYVGGLITTTAKRKHSSEFSSPKSFADKDITPGIIRSQFSNTSDALNKYSEYLENDELWSYDILRLEEATHKRPLAYLGLKIFRRFGVQELLRIDEALLFNWLTIIEQNYHISNPYHNSTHGSDVLHATAYFLNRPRAKVILEDVDRVAACLSAVVHDVDHPGRTNPFLVNASSNLALLYNDISVLESHHASLAFRLTGSSDTANIFKNISRDDYRTLRESIIDMVLATDMSKHFEHVSRFVSSTKALQISPPNEQPAPSFATETKIFDDTTLAALSSPDSKRIILRILIKCADISNPLRSRDLCVEWSKRISEEYFDQTEEEERKGLPLVMPNFDRKTCNLGKCQTGFLDFIIKDMFAAWNELIDISELMGNLEDNYAFWKSEEERIADERSKEASSSVI